MNKEYNISMGLPNPNREPVIMFFDIESTMGQYWAFRLGEQKLTWNQIKKEPVVCVICWSINDGKVQSSTFDLSKYDPTSYDDDSDKEMISKFVEIANQADLLVAHNGKSFDVAFLRGRILKHKLPDLTPRMIDDTYLQTKAIKTSSHTLDYLLRFLGIGKKVQHRGMDMWMDVGVGDAKALKEMVKYCAGDIVGLRNLYNYVKPYIQSELNLSIFHQNPDMCPKCGTKSSLRIHDGHRQSSLDVRVQYRCTNCGRYSTFGSNLISKKTLGLKPKDFPR